MWFEFNKLNHPLKSIEDISDVLTHREIEVAYMIIQPNYTYFEIAERMYVSHKTISKHASNIFKKTNVKNRKEFMDTYVLNHINQSEEE
jgi:DNA-binding CsgD family transcriptional regulator